MLFATLDTSIRRIEPGGGLQPFLLTDTVGFIDHLPATLVKAFRSTLEETKYADLLMIVSDISDPDFREHLKVTIQTLEEIGAGSIPRFYVFNKADQLGEFRSDAVSVPGMREEDRRITISAKSQEDIKRLVEAIEEALTAGHTACTLLIPYAEGQIINTLKKGSDMRILSYTDTGTLVSAMLTADEIERYKAYLK